MVLNSSSLIKLTSEEFANSSRLEPLFESLERLLKFSSHFVLFVSSNVIPNSCFVECFCKSTDFVKSIIHFAMSLKLIKVKSFENFGTITLSGLPCDLETNEKA